MRYKVLFPTSSIANTFSKVLSKIPNVKIQDEIMEKVEDLADNPRPYEERKDFFKKIRPPLAIAQYTAQYRLRISDYRVLYDVDDKRRIVWILALRRRSEKTYKNR